jgi:hypothetical protein
LSQIQQFKGHTFCVESSIVQQGNGNPVYSGVGFHSGEKKKETPPSLSLAESEGRGLLPHPFIDKATEVEVFVISPRYTS